MLEEKISRRDFIKYASLIGLQSIAPKLAYSDIKHRALFLQTISDADYLAWTEMSPEPFENHERIKIRIHSKNDFLEAIKDVGKNKKIDFFLPILHGSTYSVFFPDNSLISAYDIQEGILDGYGRYFNSNPVNSCYFHACNVAGAEKNSFAELFFKKLNINGEAPSHVVGLVPILNKEFRVPKNLMEEHDVEVKGPNLEGFSYYNVVFNGIDYTFQCYKGNIPATVFIYSFPVGVPEKIVEEFGIALSKGQIKIPDIKEWHHHEKKLIHQWKYFKNIN